MAHGEPCLKRTRCEALEPALASENGRGEAGKVALGSPEQGPNTAVSQADEKQKTNGSGDSDHAGYGVHEATAMNVGDHADEEGGNGTGDGTKSPVCVQKPDKGVLLGPRRFTSSTEMLKFFFDLLHGWPLKLNFNKYEHIMLEDLLKKGHQDAFGKIGAGIKSFQVRINPEFNSRCYHVVRKDGSTEGFSYRKCVDNLMPLPDHLKPNINITTRKGRGREDVKVPQDDKAREPRLSSERRGGRAHKLVRGSGRAHKLVRGRGKPGKGGRKV